MPALEEFSLNNFGVLSSPNLTLDLVQNTYLRRLNASGIGQIKLPESDGLEF